MGGPDVGGGGGDDDCGCVLTLVVLSVHASGVSHVAGRVEYEYVLLRMISMAAHVPYRKGWARVRVRQSNEGTVSGSLVRVQLRFSVVRVELGVVWLGLHLCHTISR